MALIDKALATHYAFRRKGRRAMNAVRIAVLFVLLVPTPSIASEPKASDFDTNFVVDLFDHEVGNDCFMRLKDGTTTYEVRWHWNQQQIRGGCPEHRSGERWQGRIQGGIKGYRIELLGVNSKGKPSVETWYISNKVQ